MKIIIPFYKPFSIDKNKYRNNCKLLLTCINSYFYNGNEHELEVVTNDTNIIHILSLTNDNYTVTITQVSEAFFKTYQVGDITDNLGTLQTMVKLSVLCNYSDENPNILLDFDTLFLSRIEFPIVDENIALFTNDGIEKHGKTINQMINHKQEIFTDLNAKWKNSGVIFFRDCKELLENSKLVYDKNTVNYSDEFVLNYLDIKTIRNELINIPPIDNGFKKEGLIHFFNPWFKPYIVTVDDNKNLKIGISTDHKLDFIPKGYLSELLSYRKYHDETFLYYCFSWWYYYGDVAGHLDDIFRDFKNYDANYFKHLIEKLF